MLGHRITYSKTNTVYSNVATASKGVG